MYGAQRLLPCPYHGIPQRKIHIELLATSLSTPARTTPLGFCSQSDPVRYVPAWGGFCSYGIAHEVEWNENVLGPNADPDYWWIKDGVLYLFKRCVEYKTPICKTYALPARNINDALLR